MAYLGVQPLKGQNRKLDNISAGFNGGNVTFNLATGGAALTPATAYQLFISVGGVLQDPGVDFTVNGNQITFTTAPATGLSFFGLYQGDAIDSVSVSDGAITSAKLATGLTVTLGAGSTSTPSVTFAGDTNTGIYSPAADTIGFVEGGTEVVRIDSSGRVGIGTTSASYALDVRTTGTSISSSFTSDQSEQYIALKDAGTTIGHVRLGSTSGSMLFFAGNGERGRFDSSGRLLVGTSTARGNFFNTTGQEPAFQVEGTTNQTARISVTRCSNDDAASLLIFGKSRSASVGGNTIVAQNDFLGGISFQGADGSEMVQGVFIYAEVDGTPGANDMPGRLVFSTTADGASSPAERMRIGNNGFTTFTTTSTLCTTRHRNDGATAGQYWNVGPDTGNTFIVYNQSSTGVYITNGGTSWTANSDERLKTGLEPITEAAQKVSSLRAVTGRYITDDETVSRAFLIAQDVQAVLPEAVNVQQDSGGTLGLQYTDVIPLLVAAIKEQQETIADLKARVASLEAQ